MRWISSLLSQFRKANRIGGLTENARSSALDLIEQNGLRAYYYMPDIGMDEVEFLHLDTILETFVRDLAKKHGQDSHTFRKMLKEVA